ncbi:mycothiol synthase [Natronincola peptidivorans]|uniref:Mycothiol synthase n=1 Tax=Natronincola peptidivorans TaxID=426128 RepID=A0A1H9ZTJ6_9FIRM|nr:GNAT family N-acetyltransferase [Natronincola peptidivorans]SES85089.1 mycothiol synthase [Natronincola peptidivorans]
MINNKPPNQSQKKLLTIQTIKSTHKPGIFELIETLNKADHLGYSLSEEWLDYIITEAEEGIFIAVYGEKVVGLASCMINHMDHSQATLNFVVHPSFRNQGFGTALYQQVMDYSRKKWLQQLETYVKKRLVPAIAFVTKRGFQPVLYSWQMEIKLDEVDFVENLQEDIIFSKATAEDGKAYAEVMNSCFGDALDDSVLQQLLRDPSIEVYMLKKNGKVIGSTTIQTKNNLSVGYIYDVAVVREYRGQGLGSYMMRCCMRILKDRDIEKASLLVTGENKAALALYHRLGFREVDTDIVMQKHL